MTIVGHSCLFSEKETMKNERKQPIKENILGRFVNRLHHWQLISAGLVVYDALALAASFFLALWFRFDCRFSMIPEDYLEPYYHFIPIYVVFALIIFWKIHLYNSIWRFASYDELLRVATATVITFVFHCVAITMLFKRMPLSYYIFGIIFQFVLTLGIRFSYRFVLLERSRRTTSVQQARAKKVMIVGAGEAGQMILRDIRKAKETFDVVKCFIDDNANKWGRLIDGVPVEGGREEILASVEKHQIDKIFLAIPSATAEQKRDILNICKETECELKNLPGIYQLYNGEVTVANMRDVSVEDLLGREPIQVDMGQIFDYVSGKRILITGAGGSIGSELTRQIAGHKPEQLILFDVYENNLYDIQLELKEKHPDLDFEALIGSVRDSRKLDEVFSAYKPEIVFHAAAHKHVPLMESSPCEAIKNNTIGTYKTAYAAMMHGCQRFVLISTDKAVNPTNIMGASKRLCEMVIQSFDRKIKEGKVHELPKLYTHAGDEFGTMEGILPLRRDIKTEFVAVRFGNVLGSNGSVIPLFKKQIAKGGPVTVTHPDIIRYFMTIPEAVSLVLQAATYARGGEIFVLDMGVAVKIDTLARNLIRLSGFKPDVDIKIEYTGLRPGEKLYEEKLMDDEGLKKTPNKMIHIGKPVAFNVETFLVQLEALMHAAYENDQNIRELVEEIVPTYHPAGREGSQEKGKAYEAQIREAAVTRVGMD